MGRSLLSRLYPRPRASRASLLAALLLLVAGLACGPSSAQAAWSTQTSTLTAVIIGGTSCPTANDCVQMNNIGRFQYTSDGGANWTASAANLTDSTWGLSCPSATVCFVTGDNGSIYKSIDHGATWSTSFAGTPALYGIDCPSTLICYAGTGDGRIRKTTDGGTSWSIGAAQTAAGLYGMSCPTTTVCYAITAAGEVRKKQAATDTWDLVASAAVIADVLSPYTHGISCPSVSVCYIGGTDGTIFSTVDAGATWQQRTTAVKPDIYAIDCWSDARCLAVGVANNSMFTDDGGATWTTESTGSAAAMYSVDFAAGTRAFSGDAIGDTYVYGAPPLPPTGIDASELVLAGTLSFIGGTPSNVVFPSVTLNGTDQVSSQVQTIDVADATGSGSGWAISATSTTFTSGLHSLATTATTVLAPPTRTCDGGANCVVASNSVTYPYTLPAAAAAPAATKLYNAAANTGMGAQTVTPTWSLSVPGTTFTGTYTSTWTFTLLSGP